LREAVGLNVERMELQTQAGGLVAQGTPSKFAMNMRFDLARLREMLNQLTSPEIENLGGVVEAKFNINETSPGEYSLVMSAEGKKLLLPAGTESARFDTLNANFPVDISVRETTITNAVMKNAVIEINDHTPVNLAGSYDQTPDKKRFAIFLKQLELSDLDTILQTLNIDAMKAYRGSVNVTAQGVLDTQTETTTINALANIEDLRVSDEYVNSQNEPLSFRADGLAYNAAAESISLKNLHVGHGSDLDFRIDDMVIQTGQTPKANGDITLEIDLGYIRRLIGAMLKPDEMKDLAGHLAYRCNLGADGTNLKLKGRGNIKRSEERRVGKECRSRWSPYH